MKRYQSGVITFIVLGIIATLLLLMIFFFSNFSFSQPQPLNVVYDKTASESLENKLSSFRVVSEEVGLAEATCYKVHPDCIEYSKRKGGFKSGQELTENEKFCMFNWCQSWEPQPVKIEIDSQEATSYLRDIFNSKKVPFSNPTIVFENGLLKAAAYVSDIYKGNLYVEGRLTKENDFKINYQLLNAQVDNLVLKGLALKTAEDRINDFFNKQLSYISGYRIDKLEVKGDILYFEGNIGNFETPSSDSDVDKGLEIQ